MNDYSVKIIEKIETRAGCWNSNRIGVYDGDVLIGEYIRNYPQLFDTFYPFQMENGNWYALYSSDYTGTRIMSLPNCKDIGGEDSNAFGFCPVELYVPKYKLEDDGELVGESELESINELNDSEYSHIKNAPWKYSKIGFVAGCYWGADYAWAIQRLDLTNADKGVIVRHVNPDLGELAPDATLKTSVRFGINVNRFFIATNKHFDFKSPEKV